jgi:hypothetical protein
MIPDRGEEKKETEREERRRKEKREFREKESLINHHL